MKQIKCQCGWFAFRRLLGRLICQNCFAKTMLFKLVFVFSLLLGIGSANAVQVVPLGNQGYTFQASDNGKFFAVDTTGGIPVLVLSSTSALGSGWEVEIFKADRTSNPVSVTVYNGNDRLNLFYTTVSCARITQDSCKIVSNGNGQFYVMGTSFHLGPVKSHRTVTVTDAGGGASVLALDVQDGRELYRVATDQRTINGQTNPGPIAIYLPPMVQITGGGYLGGNIEFVNAGHYPVYIFAYGGESLEGYQPLILTKQFESVTLYVAGDTWWITSWYKP